MNKKLKKLTVALAAALTAVSAGAFTAFADSGDVEINNTNFPDDVFRQYVSENCDRDGNGVLSQGEIEAVYNIDVPEKNIADLKGIEYFYALKSLDCSENQLTHLDVSHNTALTDLSCYSNQLTHLDVSHNIYLIYLLCHDNQLKSLDVSKNTALTQLDCPINQLTSLNVSKNTALTELWCFNNQLTSLDVSKNTALKELWCDENSLTSLDVSKNTTLEKLYCWDNQLTSLDVSKNTGLTNLWCYNNNLTSLDLSTNTALTEVYSSDNTYSIGKVATYDLKNLPAGFDIRKASDWQGATLDGSVLTNITSDKITYTYDCGNGRSETFTLTTTEKTDDGDSTSDPVSAFVNRLYTIILDRPAESAGLADWTNSLISGEKTSADIVYGLANSQEFTGKNLSNDEVIERMYMAMLGRPSDEGGKADWLDAMANGCTVNGIINGFSGSQEFANICAGYGISAGSVTNCEPRDKNVNLTAFVSRMYTKALGRAYDVDGLNDWTGDYLDGKATANDIAYGFILSEEFEGRNLSDEAYVDTLYRTFFDREPDEGGKAGWLDELAKGTSRKDVLDGFLGAEEFANLKSSFGV